MTGILVGLALLLGNAFFVGAEFAIMSARRSQIEPRAAAGATGARQALFAMEHVSLMLACCQLGITMCSLGLGAVAEPALAHLIEVPMHAFGVPDALLHPIAFAIAMTIVVYLHVVVGEMVPKNLAISMPDRAALLLAAPLVLVARTVRPVIAVLNWLANGALRLMRVDPKDEVTSTFTVEQVQAIVQESREKGLIAEGLLVAEALEFSDRQAHDVVVAVDDLVMLPADATPRDVETAVRRTGFSRFPITDGHRMIGYVHLKDALGAPPDDYDRPLPGDVLRPFQEVSATADIEVVLAAMQRSRGHLARVVDGHGGQLGVVFMEDVIEVLVGEIQDGTTRDQQRRRAAGRV